jgi:hypothetical protein
MVGLAMIVFGLASLYLACCVVLLSVYLQDRAKSARARRRAEHGRGTDPRATHTPELVVRTHA